MTPSLPYSLICPSRPVHQSRVFPESAARAQLLARAHSCTGEIIVKVCISATAESEWSTRVAAVLGAVDDVIMLIREAVEHGVRQEMPKRL